jgi:superfamily II DNA or RNA helicase
LGDKRFIKFINLYNTIIVDETHQAKSHTLKTILGQATRAQYRLGFTGTLHAGDLDNWNVKAYIGPVIRDYPSQLLAKWGYVAKCNVNTINIDYEDPYDERFYGNWATVRDDVFNNHYRMEVLKTLVKQVDSTCLLLVGRVDLEGKILKKVFKEAGIDKEVVFLSGKTATLEERDFWRKEAIKRKDLIVIATYQIFQVGINIPPLKYLIMAAPFKSKIRVLQSIGRALRKHADKVNGAEIFDIADICKHFDKQANIRQRMYGSERFNVREIVLREGDQFDLASSFPEIFEPSS